jgi:hypothetical protein
MDMITSGPADDSVESKIRTALVIRALTARRASHQLWSYAGLIVERYRSLFASVARSTASLVGAILNALHYKLAPFRMEVIGAVMLTNSSDTTRAPSIAATIRRSLKRFMGKPLCGGTVDSDWVLRGWDNSITEKMQNERKAH